MSLLGALTTAVGGLNAQELAMSNIANNISNAQTVGYKEVDTSFNSLVVTSNGVALEGSVTASTASQNELGGPLIASQESTSVAVNGNGMFSVSYATSASGSATPIFSPTSFYTRRGDFTQNQNGYLVNGAGYYLNGYTINQATGLPSGSTVAPIKIPLGESTPQATTLTSLVANLPSSYPIQGTNGYTSPSPVTETIYDAQGAAHTLSVQFDKTANNTWNAAITADGQASPVTDLTLTFSDGTTALGTGTAPAGTLVSVVDAGSTTAATISTAGLDSPATVLATMSLNGVSQAITLNLGSYGENGGVTQFSDSSTNITAGSPTQNGYAAGLLSSVSIDANGFVNATYSNSQIVKIGQVAIAQFPDENQLDSTNGGAFTATATSGSATVSVPGANGAGALSPSTLEQSNVNLTDQLTQMIAAQQAYSSNSRVVTTTNQMMQTLNGLIQ